MDVQRIGKLQRQRSELEGPYPDPHSGPALEPQAIRVDGDLDVVIEDVVIEQIVLVVEASPRGELLLRRVQRDVVVPAAIDPPGASVAPRVAEVKPGPRNAVPAPESVTEKGAPD